MKIKIIIPGKIKDSYLKDGIKDYQSRIQKYTKIEIIYIDEEKINPVNEINIKKALDIEASKILNLIRSDEYLILLDVNSTQLSSSQFTEKINSIFKTKGNITFVIGSSYGISDKLKEKSNFSFSLSKLTFTHYMTLYLLMEQIYRSFKILNNEPYDK